MTGIKLIIDSGGLQENEEGYRTQQEFLKLFQDALNLQASKAIGYGDAWASQGYMGNVGRVLSKAARVKNLLWRDHAMQSADEPVEDTLLDLVNISVFALINYRRQNKWGS